MQETPSKSDYRVHTALTASKHVSGSSCRFVTIPQGSVITVTGTPKEFDLVDIECQGEMLAVFNRDIQERTERYESA
jgi:hypothetical protein